MFSGEKRILCVDDDVDSCKFLEFMLAGANDYYIVKSAYSAKNAIKMIENEPFDLYILDNWMMDYSGVQLCSLIRHLYKQKPVLFFSAADRPVYREEAFKAGANEYLIKPNDLGRIEEVVFNLLLLNDLKAVNDRAGYF